MSKVLVVNHKKCTNCRLCELSCSMVKTGEFSPTKSKIRVNAFPKDAAYTPLACFQCGDAPCVDVCPTGSLSKTPALVKHDDDTCIGCRMCMLACPFGVISYDSAQGVITKCNTCDGNPECVQFCPTGALEYKESDLADATKGKDFAQKIVEASR